MFFMSSSVLFSIRQILENVKCFRTIFLLSDSINRVANSEWDLSPQQKSLDDICQDQVVISQLDERIVKIKPHLVGFMADNK